LFYSYCEIFVSVQSRTKAKGGWYFPPGELLHCTPHS